MGEDKGRGLTSGALSVGVMEDLTTLVSLFQGDSGDVASLSDEEVLGVVDELLEEVSVGGLDVVVTVRDLDGGPLRW